MDLPSGVRHLSPVLRGLARNPAAPAAILLELMEVRLLAWAVARSHPSPPDEVLAHLLADGDPEVLSGLGVPCVLPASVRERMAAHPSHQVRMRALRGGAPTDLVQTLVDDPAPEVRAEVAARRDLPDGVRAALSRDEEAEVRLAVARSWHHPPDDVHRALLTDPVPKVRAAAVSVWHRPPPPDLVAALLADPATRAETVRYARIEPDWVHSPDEGVRTAVAEHPDLDAATAAALRDDPDPSVVYALIFNPGTPEPLRVELLAQAAAEPRKGFIDDYYLYNGWKDRGSTGWLWDAPLAVRLSYVDSPHYFLRRAVANTDLPPDAVARLLRDPDPGVQRNVARRNDVAPDELARIVTEHGEDVSVRPMLTELPQFPESAYEQLAVSPDPQVRRFCGKTSRLPADLAERLAGDEVAAVRVAAAAQTDLPPDLLARLICDEDEHVAEAAGASPALPLAWMQALARQAPAIFPPSRRRQLPWLTD